MTGPLAFAFTTVPVSRWPAKPSPSPVPRATCQVCDWHSSWHALTDGLALILALALHWPSTPTPTSGIHNALCSQSLVFAVPRIRVWGPSCLCSQSLIFVFVASCSCLCLWPHVRVCVCGLTFVFVFAFAASHLCLCLCLQPRIHVRVCICGLVFVFVFAFAALHSCLCLHLRPCVRVHVHSPSHLCLHSQSLVFAFTTGPLHSLCSQLPPHSLSPV